VLHIILVKTKERGLASAYGVRARCHQGWAENAG
jgi:hypothetical protein